ncbi:MAG: SDR family oxidoreductase [Thermodesulfobacteriota bacterium]|jgi:NAD(P)-dependent dehydrogenase (short-subunit alcohol dehydrogenase family)
MSLEGQVAVVTGAARRLGRLIALALAEGGADVVVHVHTSAGEEVVRAVEARGRRAFLLQADLSRREEVLRFARDAVRRAGHVDILVNNAAVYFPTPIADLTLHTWHTIFRVNLTAPFTLSLVLGRAMRARGGGSIVHLSDWSGWRPLPGYLPYCVSKGGLHALTPALAKALAPEVRVNSLALGPVLVPDAYGEEARRTLAAQTPLRHLGDGTEVARAVRFLVEQGSFVTGSCYVVDGGWFARAPDGIGISL